MSYNNTILFFRVFCIENETLNQKKKTTTTKFPLKCLGVMNSHIYINSFYLLLSHCNDATSAFYRYIFCLAHFYSILITAKKGNLFSVYPTKSTFWFSYCRRKFECGKMSTPLMIPIKPNVSDNCHINPHIFCIVSDRCVCFLLNEKQNTHLKSF